MQVCPECNGVGYTYYDEDGMEITADEYEQLPHDRRDREACDYCGGAGEVECDDELDYEDYE